MAIIKAVLKQAGFICGSFAIACCCAMVLMFLGLLFNFTEIRTVSVFVMFFVFVGSMAFFNFSEKPRAPQATASESDLPEMKLNLIKAVEEPGISPMSRNNHASSAGKEASKEMSLGFLSGKKLMIDGSFVKFEDIYSQNFTVQANKISTVSVSPARWGYGYLIITGNGAELARIKLPLQWAENCMKWLIVELNL